MSQEFSVDWSETKEELEVGQTVMQPAGVDYPISVKVEPEHDYGYSQTTSSSVMFKDDIGVKDDRDRSTSPDDPLPPRCVPGMVYTKECWAEAAGEGPSQHSQTLIKREVGGVQSAPDAPARARAAPESRSGGPPPRAPQPAPVVRHAAAARGEAPCRTTAATCAPNTSTEHRQSYIDKRPFHCEISNTIFTRAHSLKKPIRTHSAEKPFKCKICNAKFTEAGSLKTHKRTHTGERPFKCKICNAKFRQAGNLKTHKRIHTGERPFECEICNAKFTQAGNLKTHKRKHTGERPFECEICNAKFTQASDLKMHKRVHTGERPFECEICNANFTRAGHLKTHERIHYW